MKKKLLIIISCILYFNELHSQNIIFDLNEIRSRPDTSFEIFLLSRNPALLNFGFLDERLNITSFYSSHNDRIKRFFVPQGYDFYQIQFSGMKRIDENQIFKGHFGFNKEIRKNWNWIFTKEYRTGNPFLVGDSSTGNSTFNGIYFDANYFNQLNKRLTLGTGLEYFVDEGLKQVSPKPTSQHRNIHFKIGATYKLFEKLIAAISFQLEDKKEEISYKEDEGAVYKEVTILKFRGFDFPITIKKKTEDRVAFLNGYSVSGDLIFHPSNRIQVLGNVRKGVEQIIQKDEITNPQSQGHFQNGHLKAVLNSSMKLGEKISSIVGLEYFSSESWSRHPNYFSVISDNNQKFICSKASFVYTFNRDLSFNIGASFGYLQMKTNDFYSDVFFNLKAHLYSFLTGFNLLLGERFRIRTNFFIENYEPKSWSLDFSQPKFYFVNYFIKDNYYFSTRFLKYELGISILINSIFGEFILDVNYHNWKPLNSIYWDNDINSGIQYMFSYLVKVY